jgi:replicative DNA helicase
LQEITGIDLIIVDYLQLMQAHQPDGKRYQMREREIAEISGNLKEVAKELGVPILALAQLSRAVEARQDKRPQLSDLRESGAIENDADVVMLLYPREQDAQERANQVDLLIAKHRNGPTGEVRLRFDPLQTCFFERD